MKTVIAVALAAGLLAACTMTPEPSDPLTGTSWRLLEMQSMDDAQGTTRADTPIATPSLSAKTQPLS